MALSDQALGEIQGELERMRSELERLEARKRNLEETIRALERLVGRSARVGGTSEPKPESDLPRPPSLRTVIRDVLEVGPPRTTAEITAIVQSRGFQSNAQTTLGNLVSSELSRMRSAGLVNKLGDRFVMVRTVRPSTDSAM